MIKRYFQPSFTLDSNESSAVISNTILEGLYQDQVEKNLIKYDEAQMEVLKHLQSLLQNIRIYADHFDKLKWRMKRFSVPKKLARGAYIFGGVGSGKSMLMDLFFDACPIKKKRRVHFHVFMREVHEFVHQWRKDNHGNAIPSLAKKIRESTLLLCFDEFHVTDIADAMILGRLFGELFDQGIVLVATSNRHPDDLYQGGLQRELFLPFIHLLKDAVRVVELSAREDYRMIHLNGLKSTFYYPLNNDADLFLMHSCNELTNNMPMYAETLQTMGRDIELSSVHGKIAMVTFEEICMRPLSAIDYLEIARRFTTLMISRIPVFSPENRNEAKRFVTLIDILYEHNVKLICTAEAAPQELYTEGDGLFEFQRTVSRLMEMQTENYLRSEHVCS